MRIEFDAAKNARNIQERGLDFRSVADFDFETALVIEDVRNKYAERRFRAMGFLGDELHALVFTPRAGGIRVISLRKASRKERRLYAKTKAD
jgi:uncharacterized DUF497 family protein